VTRSHRVEAQSRPHIPPCRAPEVKLGPALDVAGQASPAAAVRCTGGRRRCSRVTMSLADPAMEFLAKHFNWTFE
jgi:hypothetical protein